jgi:hypothetical protein
VCGINTDSSVVATVKDLVAYNFQVFVVKDAMSSKNGKDAHEKGLSEISSLFGPDVVVTTEDLLGDVDGRGWAEQVVEESTTLAPAPAPKPAQTAAKKPLTEMTEAERAEEMRRRDAEKLAARKKQFDASRFAHIEKANAIAQEQAAVFQKRVEEKRIPGATYTPKTAATPPTAEQINEKPKQQRKGYKLLYKKREEPPPKVVPSKPLPPIAGKAERPTNVRQEVTPGWASVDKKQERPQTQLHSSDINCKGLANSAPDAVNPVVPYIAGPTGPKFETVGYGTQGKKPQMQGVSVSNTINNLGGSGLKTYNTGPRKMVKPKVIVDTKETFDAYGNITRTITRHITDPDGKKRTETEVVQIPKK